MSTTEILVYVAVSCLALGFLVCWLAFVLPAQLEIEMLRIRNTSRGLHRIRDGIDELEYRAQLRQAVHKGTPYLVSTRDEARRPGVRMVDGEPRYSSQWLNDEATA